MKELKPCPWCEHNEMFIGVLDFETGGEAVSVSCLNCPGTVSGDGSRESAIEMWNSLPRQAEIDALKAERDALKSVGDKLNEALRVTSGHTEEYERLYYLTLDKMESLQTELDELRKRLKWTTYDGTEETLPPLKTSVLIPPAGPFF